MSLGKEGGTGMHLPQQALVIMIGQEEDALMTVGSVRQTL